MRFKLRVASLLLLAAALPLSSRGAAQPVAEQNALGVALLEAIESGETAVALSLIPRAALGNVFTSDTTSTGESLRKAPLHLAAQYGRAEVARELLSAGADVEVQTANGVTPLGYAATYGHAGVTRVLLDAGAQYGVVYPDSSSALLVAAGIGYRSEYHTAARGFNSSGHADVFRVLLRAGAPLDTDVYRGGIPRQPFGVMEAAAVSGSAEVLREAIGADTSGQLLREDGVRAFGYAVISPVAPAAVSDPLPALEVLYEAGVRPDSMALGRMLINAARWGVSSSARYLIEIGAPLDHRQPAGGRDEGHTALTLAARGGHLAVVRVLLSAGANATLTGVNDRTPLEFAVRYGRDDVVAFLEHYHAGRELDERRRP